MNDWQDYPADRADISYIKDCMTEVAEELGAPQEPELTRDFRIACNETGAIKAEATMAYRWGVGKISGPYIPERFRRQGNGREMLSLIEQFSRANNIRALKVDTTSLECAELYKHCGYEEHGRVPMGVTINGIEQYSATYTRVLN